MNANQVKPVFKVFVVTALLVLFLACNEKDYKENVAAEPVAVLENYAALKESDNAVPALEGTSAKIPLDIKIIKSANARYKVKEVKVATRKIQHMAQQLNGYISDQRFENDLYKIENRFSIKIPQQNFNVMMDSISAVAAFVDYENITTEDVTEEFIDIETRLKTKLEVKERYEEILRKNAKTVKDILATEEKLRIIQEEIEAAQGRLNYLTNKIAYSTIQVDLYQTVVYKEEPESYSRTFLSKTKNGFSFGWAIIEFLALGIIYLWPLVIAGAGVFVFFFVKRKSRT